jgi:hypothetical protein
MGVRQPSKLVCNPPLDYALRISRRRIRPSIGRADSAATAVSGAGAAFRELNEPAREKVAPLATVEAVYWPEKSNGAIGLTIAEALAVAGKVVAVTLAADEAGAFEILDVKL